LLIEKRERIVMSCEKTLIIIKPDGLTKKLVGLIVEKVYQYGLTITGSERICLSKELLEELYSEIKNKEYFIEVVNWISSAPVLILIIEGVDAVSTVKQKIIGKYPNGLRGRFSENLIKNIAHASDSVVSAQKEIRLIEPILKRNKELSEKKLSNKIIFALTGMSECGKSTVGKYFDSKGIPRLKIVKIFEKVKDTYKPNKDVKTFTSIEEKRDPYALWDAFIEQLLAEMNERKVNVASIESLYGGGLGYYLKQKLGNHFHIIFIEASEEKRIKLQMIRENINDANRAKQLLLSRDRIKNDSGIPQLKEIADEIIDNSGSINQLYEKVDKIIHKYFDLY
jgi:nucleoside-diphosphate kinase